MQNIYMGLYMGLLIFCNYNLIVQIRSALLYFALRYSMSVCEKLTETLNGNKEQNPQKASVYAAFWGLFFCPWA